MDEFNNFQFNVRRYEDKLSSFGRKVIKVLEQKWKSDQYCVQKSGHRRFHQQGANSIRNKRILSFRDKETFIPTQCPAPSPIICDNITRINSNGNCCNCTELNISHSNDILTNLELVKTVNTSDKAVYIDDFNIGSDDLSNPIIDDPSCLFKYTKKYDQTTIHSLTPANINKANRDRENIDVGWDNMFDTELLSHEGVILNAQSDLEPMEPCPSNTYDTQLFRGKNKTSESKEKVNKPAKKSENKITKRKNQQISDVIPKKVKAEPKIRCGKRKCIKVVKNWLNDVDPSNPVEKDENIEPTKLKLQAKIFIEKEKRIEKLNKKVVQAQLTNKDGVMKFRIPKSDIISNNMKTPQNEIESTSIEDNNTGGNSNMTEDKKTTKNIKKTFNLDTKIKTKFVAPIKSQIPLKEVEFPISIVDGNNNENHLKAFKSIENQDLILVLKYRNGYCQLNNHHTEDTSDPEGFMLSIDGDFFFFFNEDYQNIRDILQSLLNNNNIVCYGGKLLLVHFKSELDLDIYNVKVIDVEIGGNILDPDDPPENFSELQKLLSFTPRYTIATECALQKTAWYALQLKECACILISSLMEEQLWNVFVDIEMKLLPIIADMERRGVNIDLEKLKRMEGVHLTKMKLTELECHKAAGRTFQVNSPVQVRALIYDDLKLDAKCNVTIRETLAQGAKSTSESMLRGLVTVHPLPRLILEYRHLHKAHATFLAGIAYHIRDGAVKPTWVQAAAATGRISSNNPNLQAIPKAPFSLVLFPESIDNTGDEALNFRSVYTSRAGYWLVACDFRHVECRVFAHLAPDAALLACLRGPGDLFRLLAHKWLQKPERSVTSEDRERTKRIVYACLYGAGARKLADILGVGYEQALAVQASFNGTFPSLKRFGQSVVSRCEAGGGRLATLGGRVRRFNNMFSGDSALRAQAERQAVNFIIQGSAADLCKMAMVEACSRLRSHCPPLDGHLLLQIHDELVWEVKDEHLDAAAEVIVRAMEECGLHSGMEDTLPVAVSVGRSWGDMSEYRPPRSRPVLQYK